MNPGQIKLVPIAQCRAGLDDAAYGIILRNVADVASSKQLTNAGLEDVLAVFEEYGFRLASQPADHFRNKVRLCGALCAERLA